MKFDYNSKFTIINSVYICNFQYILCLKISNPLKIRFLAYSYPFKSNIEMSERINSMSRVETNITIFPREIRIKWKFGMNSMK
jgi:hypothetical protein